MHKKNLLFVLIVSLFSITLLAQPILSINQPIKTLKITTIQMKDVITQAAESQNWVITPIGEGELSASYHYSNYMAKILIHYAPTYYTINYADSIRMRYRGTSIHPTYNRLIKSLQANIVRNLKTGNFTNHIGTALDTNTTESITINNDSIHTKLTNIKKLYEESLITQEEYNMKRKSLIEAY